MKLCSPFYATKTNLQTHTNNGCIGEVKSGGPCQNVR